MNAIFKRLTRNLKQRNPWNQYSYPASRQLTDDVSKRYNQAVQFVNALPLRNDVKDEGCLSLMRDFLDRVSISLEDLDGLNIIHLSGTKGKGSTGAFVESILHQNGYKTGFCSSPHLFEMRERFRVSQKPISKSCFLDRFEDLQKRLSANPGEDFPSWPYFCTLMAFQVFIAEKVDVAIMEVGLGGAYDPTNVIKHPVVCGVAFLDYDHVKILGDTIESIAWHKSGIFKNGTPAFTSPQSDPAMGVLGQRAVESKVLLQICPDLATYPTENGQPILLGLAGNHQMDNASLALQLSECWMKRKEHKWQMNGNEDGLKSTPETAAAFVLKETHLKGLANCFWKGRCQVIKFKNLTFYLDGAHTVESMRCCADWFKEAASLEEGELGRECKRILAFSVTNDRDVESFLEVFGSIFTFAVFTSNIATLRTADALDHEDLSHPLEPQMKAARKCQRIWRKIHSRKVEFCDLEGQIRRSNQSGSLNMHSGGNALQSVGECVDTDADSTVFPSITDTVAWLAERRDEKLYKEVASLVSTEESHVPGIPSSTHVQVLVSGSLYLVGGFLSILDPNMND